MKTKLADNPVKVERCKKPFYDFGAKKLAETIKLNVDDVVITEAPSAPRQEVGWEERFDKQFKITELYMPHIPVYWIKDFIKTEISLAEQRGFDRRIQESTRRKEGNNN